MNIIGEAILNEVQVWHYIFIILYPHGWAKLYKDGTVQISLNSDTTIFLYNANPAQTGPGFEAHPMLLFSLY